MAVTYDDGEAMLAGDAVLISDQYHGVVIANIDNNSYKNGEEGWAYLGSGVMIFTDVAGLVHYPDSEHESFTLVARKVE